jgi:hypothetical protein
MFVRGEEDYGLLEFTLALYVEVVSATSSQLLITSGIPSSARC